MSKAAPEEKGIAPVAPLGGDIVVYQAQDGRVRLDVRLADESVWLTQQHIATLFQTSIPNISMHIRNIYQEGELAPEATVKKFLTVQREGQRDVKREREHYNLDMIISVGYRVKSAVATHFRMWATQRLKEYIVKGFALDDERFKTGQSMRAFDELQERIRQIRLSERLFYQKVKDIYATSVDYDPSDERTKQFFKVVQNKLLWAISQQTAAELVYRRADATLPLMGMLSSDKKDETLIRKADASVAKNYLNEGEIRLLGLLVEQYLAFAETMAQQRIPMYMNDWIARLDAILQLNGRELLTHAGKISHELALEKSAMEYAKFKEQRALREREQSLKELEEDVCALQAGTVKQ